MAHLNVRFGVTCVLALILAAPRALLAGTGLEARGTGEGGRSLDGAGGAASPQGPGPGDATGDVHVYDTEASALSGEAVSSRAGWKEVSPGETGGSFTGAACVSNGSLALVLRRESRAPQCFYRVGARMIEGPTLVAAGTGGEMSRMIAAFQVVENGPAGVAVEVDTTVGPSEKITARYLIRRRQAVVEIQPGNRTESVRIEAPGKYAVLPDIFGGDLVVGATDAPELRFPSERLLLQLLDGGDAIVACAWPSPGQRVRLFCRDRAFVASEVACSGARGERVAVAVLAAPAIWREEGMAELDPVKDRKLDWLVPFPAQWRADFPRTDGLVDSWKCVIRKTKGSFERFGVTSNLNAARTVWTTARGDYAYPACIDGDACLLRKSRFEEAPDIRYDDSRAALVYPYRALDGGPAGVAGVVDVWRDALADLSAAPPDDELQIRSVPRDKWPATCDVTANYEEVFDSGEEKARRAYLLERLDAMEHFVVGIRSRMNEYLDWGRSARAFCAKTKAEQPQLAATVDELDAYLARFDQVYRERKLDERNPAAVQALSAKVVALIDSVDGGKGDRAKAIGRETRTVGGNQDDSIGDFHRLTQELRQRAGLCMVGAKDDATFEFARALRQRTMEMLQSAFVHEFATTD
jgi:hypothetical protein